MRKPSHYFLTGVLCFVAIYGCLWLLGFMLEKAFDSAFKGYDINITANSISPNQEYIAITYTDSGGGAAGWCYITVNLRKRDEHFDSKKNMIFYTGCSSSVDVTWQNDKALLITYSTDRESISLYQKSWSEDKTVKISYLAK